MVHAGDTYIQYPVKDLYDKDIMRMSIAAAKDMYEKGLQLIKDFYKEYGDFMSPILKDMEWYDLNVTGRVRDTISNLYANGIDPLRSAEGRAAVALLIYSMPTGNISKVRLSAAAANEFIKNRGKLLAAGKYDKDLNERYLGYNLDNYSTLGQDGIAGSGVWNITSPLEAMSLKELTESSFNNRTAHDLTKDDVESFDGYTYDPRARYTGFTKKDLRQIADKIAPGLYGTPYMDYYRDLARQQVIAAGLDLTDKNINAQLAENIALSQDEYLIKPKADYGDHWQQAKLALEREKFAWLKQKDNEELALKRQKQQHDLGGENTELDGISLAQRWYDTGAAKIYSADGPKRNWWDMQNLYMDFSNSVDKIFYDFGQKVSKSKKGMTFDKVAYDRDRNTGSAYGSRKNVDKNDPKYWKAGNAVWKNRINVYENEFSIEMSRDAVRRIIGDSVPGNDLVVLATDGNIDYLYGVNDVISNTAGFTAQHDSRDTDTIRNTIKKYGSRNTTITPLGKGYSSLRKNSGSMEVMPKVRVTVTDDNGNVVMTRDAYYDIGLGSEGTKGGAYLSGYKEPSFENIRSGEGYQVGKYLKLAPDIVDLQYNPGRQFNMNPDYNRWTQYGVWDTMLTSSMLNGKADKYLGTY